VGYNPNIPPLQVGCNNHWRTSWDIQAGVHSVNLSACPWKRPKPERKGSSPLTAIFQGRTVSFRECTWMVSKFSQWFLKLKDIKPVALSFHVICRIRRVVLLYSQSGLELNLNRIHRNHLKIQLGKGTSFFLGMLTTYPKFEFQASNE